MEVDLASPDTRAWSVVSCDRLSLPARPADWAQTPAAGSVTALTGARVIDGTGRPPIEQATILMSGGTITAVGAVFGRPGASGRDAGRACRARPSMPGMVNAHGHVQKRPENNLSVRDDLVRRLRVYASYGVTTILSLGSNPGDDEIEAHQAAGRAGPRSRSIAPASTRPAKACAVSRRQQEGRKACRPRRRSEGGHRQDALRRPARRHQRRDRERDHRPGAQARPEGRRAHLLPAGGEGRAGRWRGHHRAQRPRSGRGPGLHRGDEAPQCSATFRP